MGSPNRAIARTARHTIRRADAGNHLVFRRFFPPKCLPIKSSANTTSPGSSVYRFLVATRTYVMSGPTVRAVLEGSVHGVVVHAKK